MMMVCPSMKSRWLAGVLCACHLCLHQQGQQHIWSVLSGKLKTDEIVKEILIEIRCCMLYSVRNQGSRCSVGYRTDNQSTSEM